MTTSPTATRRATAERQDARVIPSPAPGAAPGGTRLLAVCGYVPNPITLRKMDALHRTGRYEVHLAYWRSPASPSHYPFTTDLHPATLHPIDVPLPPSDYRSVVLRVAAGQVRLARFHRGLLRVIGRVRPDIIHASNSNMLICAWLACLGHPRRALVYDLLDTDDGMRQWPVTALQRLMHRRVDRISVPSPGFVHDFLRPLDLIDGDVEPTTIPNAPWRETFDGLPTRHGSSLAVGCIGSLRCQPALEWLVSSVAALRARGLDLTLRFAGNGVARPFVEQAAATHAFVHYHGPYDFAREARALYGAVDVVYAVYDDSPDKQAHLACRLSDAVASGRAIIVREETHMARLVRRDDLGYVVDPADPESLPAALEDAVARLDHWRDPFRLSDDLRATHTFDTYLPSLYRLYDEALIDRRGAMHERGATHER